MTDPVVPDNPRRVRYVVTNPAGQDTFVINFPVVVLDDGINTTYGINVYLNDELVDGADYTVDLEAMTVVLDTPAEEDDIVVLQGATPRVRQLEYQLRGGPPSSRLNQEFNSLYYIVQELVRDRGRAVTLSPSAADAVSTELPFPVANALLGWDEAGQRMQNYAIADIDKTLVTDHWKAVLASGQRLLTVYIEDIDEDTPDNITVDSASLPEGFELVDGMVLYLFPTQPNPGLSPFTITIGLQEVEVKKITPDLGYQDLDAFIVGPTSPLIVTYKAADDIFVNLTSIYHGRALEQASNLTINGTEFFNRYVFTTAATIDATGFDAAALQSYYWIRYVAAGGDVTFEPHDDNKVNGGADGAAFVIPQGSAGYIFKLPNGDWWVTGARLSRGSWTPTITFATPGNLAVTYAAQVGSYVKNGDMVTAQFSIITSGFTHTSASGALVIGTLPFPAANIGSLVSNGALEWQGITKANYTHMNLNVGPNSSGMNVTASGSGQALATIGAGDMPTGGTVILRGTLTYRAAL